MGGAGVTGGACRAAGRGLALAWRRAAARRTHLAGGGHARATPRLTVCHHQEEGKAEAIMRGEYTSIHRFRKKLRLKDPSIARNCRFFKIS